jgi:hypothetical protein
MTKKKSKLKNKLDITEKVWTVFGPEFGDDAGKHALIYGFKSSGTVLMHHLAECMNCLGWKSRHADRDLWIKAGMHPDDGMLYWACMLIYVDAILCVYCDPGVPLGKLDEYFKIKEGSIQVPNFYLGVKLKWTVLSNGAVAWGMISRKYVQSAVHNVKEYLTALSGGNKLMKKAYCPFIEDKKT